MVDTTIEEYRADRTTSRFACRRSAQRRVQASALIYAHTSVSHRLLCQERSIAEDSGCHFGGRLQNPCKLLPDLRGNVDDYSIGGIYSTRHLIMNRKTSPDWISYSRMGALDTNVSTTTPVFLVFL